MLCGSTMAMVGGAGETEWAIEKLSIPPYFQLNAHFSRIIDGSRDVQLSGMKMSQSLGSQGRKRPQSGSAGGRIHAAAIVFNTCRRMSMDLQCHCCQYCISRESVALKEERKLNTCTPPLPDLASRWKKKMAKLQRLIPCHREIDLRRPPWWNLTSAATSLWLEDTRSCMFHTAGNTDIVEWWNMCEQTSKDAILAMMQLCNREKSPNWKSKVQMQFLSTTGCGMIDSCSLRIGQRILDAESKYGRRSSANDAAMTRWQPQHPCGNITLKSVIHFPRCYNKQYTVATQCFILKEEHLDTRSKGYVAMHREKIIPAYRRGPELRGFVAVTEVSDKSHGWIGEQKQLPQEVVTRALESHKRQLAAAMSHEVIELEFVGG